MKGSTAIVFAYHDIGVVGLESLLRAGVDIKLVVTHQDNPEENIWFGSVSDVAKRHGIRVIKPDAPNQADVVQSLEALNPEWIFSFYYRHMLSQEILSIPACGAYNLHGSLLPRYRGRAPVNWAVLHGEAETGVSLHQMVEKPDAGSLVGQESVEVLPNDTAHDVFLKLTPAAERLLDRCLPQLLAGEAHFSPLDLAQGSYFSGRKPEDGRIDWNRPAWEIHNLIRAVAPPYPGAFFDYRGQRFFILGSFFASEKANENGQNQDRVCIYEENDSLYADCADGFRFRIEQLVFDGKPVDHEVFKEKFSEDHFFPLQK